MNTELKDAILATSAKIGMKPEDMATIMSYETGGTFDPWKAGPTTQYGQHRGLIQWGEPQRKQYGVHSDMSITEQVDAAGRFWVAAGFRPGMGLTEAYAAINAGNVKNINASDANNGGAPGTVLDKVRDQMEGHKAKAAALLGGTYVPTERSPAVRGDFNTFETHQDPGLNVAQEPTPNFFETAGNVLAESDTAWYFRKNGMYGPEGTPDENFELTPQRLEDDLKANNLDPEKYGRMFDTAFSEDRYQMLMEQAKASVGRQQQIAQAGLTGTALQVVTEIAEDLPLDMAVGLAAPYMVLGNKASRLARFLASGTSAAAVNATGEAIGAAANPNKNTDDIIFGAASGMILGGAIGSLMRNPHVTEEAFHLQKTSQDFVNTQGGRISYGSSTAGAAHITDGHDFLKNDLALSVADQDVAKSALSKVRVDLAGQMGSSPNVITRMFSIFTQDGVGKVGHAINPIATTEETMRFFEGWTNDLNRTAAPAMKAYFKDQGTSFFGRSAAQQQFAEDVAKAIRERDPGAFAAFHPEVQKVARKVAALQNEIRKLLNNPSMREGLSSKSVAGFEELAENPNYLMRVWDNAKVSNAFLTYGKQTMDQLFEGAIARANPDMPTKMIQTLASGFTKGIINRAHGIDEMAMRAMAGDNIDAIEKFLKEATEVSDNDADEILNFLRSKATKKDDAGNSTRAKHRVLLDEKFELPGVRALKTGVDEGQSLKIEDLLVNDAFYLFNRYARQTAGLAALARVRIKAPNADELIVDGITKDGDFEKVIELVRERAAQDLKEGNKKSHDNLDRDIANLQFAYDWIRGRPTGKHSEGMDDFLRLARKFNYTRVLNQVGFAQVPEFGRMVAHLGVKAAFSQTPVLRRILNESGEWVRNSKLHEDIENVLPFGINDLGITKQYRFDELAGNPASLNRGRFRDKAEGVLDKMGEVTTHISGLQAMETTMRTWVATGIVQKWMNFAHTGKGFTEARLSDLGLDKVMTDRVLGQMKKEGNFETTKGWLSNNKVVRAHFDKWDDLEAREAFLAAAYRDARSIIQSNDIGNMHRVMGNAFAKTLMQFRTFMLGSYVKGTLKSVHFRDGQAAASILMGSMLAGLTYVVQTKLKALGRDDRREYEDKLLTWQNIGAAAFSRIGESSVIPMLMDSAAPALGRDPLFSHTRTSGQTSDIVFGNPTVNLLFNDSVSAMSGAISPITKGRSISQQEANSLKSLLPFQNFLPVTLLFNGLIQDLPKYTPRDRD